MDFGACLIRKWTLHCVSKVPTNERKRRLLRNRLRYGTSGKKTELRRNIGSSLVISSTSLIHETKVRERGGSEEKIVLGTRVKVEKRKHQDSGKAVNMFSRQRSHYNLTVWSNAPVSESWNYFLRHKTATKEEVISVILVSNVVAALILILILMEMLMAMLMLTLMRLVANNTTQEIPPRFFKTSIKTWLKESVALPWHHQKRWNRTPEKDLLHSCWSGWKSTNNHHSCGRRLDLRLGDAASSSNWILRQL